MPLTVNITELSDCPKQISGEIGLESLDLDRLDDLISASTPLSYDLTVENRSNGLSVIGSLKMTFQCECSRCLKPFPLEIQIPEWEALLNWEGEDRVEICNDCVDLTPYLREDIVLELPQRPLCEPDCAGIAVRSLNNPAKPGNDDGTSGCSDWSELNKLKF